MSMSLQQVDPLADLRVNYFARLRTRVEMLDEFVRGCSREGGPTAESLADSHRLVHSMISSSAIFGFMELSKAARVTEKEFEEHYTPDNTALVYEVESLSNLTNQVQKLINLANGVLTDACNRILPE